MARGDLLHRVRLVKNDKIILEQYPALQLLLQPAQVHEEQSVIEHQHVGRQNPAAGLLKETRLAAVLHEIG